MDVPLGIRLVDSCGHPAPTNTRMRRYQLWITFLTFLTYMTYHMSRKITSVVKTELNPKIEYNSHGDPINMDSGWAPFNAGDDIVDGIRTQGKNNLGLLDTSFLFAYAIGMFFSGHLGDRSNLRLFLTTGMFGCALMCFLFGLAYFTKIHELWYFLLIQAVSGFFQTTGWPSVVAVMGKWSPKGKRGLLMGIWNSHTSVGNILGTVIPAAVMASSNWGWAFFVPGFIVVFIALLVYFFLVVYPQDVGLPHPDVLVSDIDLAPCFSARACLCSAVLMHMDCKLPVCYVFLPLVYLYCCDCFGSACSFNPQ
eukprot:m.127892 g.127892  ORF g.127892 m.127892 type:complete len:309 (+) comp13859_c0_seq1:247-1173(+)